MGVVYQIIDLDNSSKCRTLRKAVEIATSLAGFAMTFLSVQIVLLDVFEDAGMDHAADVGARSDPLTYQRR